MQFKFSFYGHKQIIPRVSIQITGNTAHSYALFPKQIPKAPPNGKIAKGTQAPFVMGDLGLFALFSSATANPMRKHRHNNHDLARPPRSVIVSVPKRSEEHTSELQSHVNL